MANTGQDIAVVLDELYADLRKALSDMRSYGRKMCAAEFTYKIAFRKEFIRLHVEDGVAWTACGDLTRGQINEDGTGVATLRMNYYFAKVEYEAASEKINCVKLELRHMENEMNVGMGGPARRL